VIELYFLASPTRQRPDEAGQLVRMKTSVGAPHVAFATRRLAEEYISALGMGLTCWVLAAEDLNEDIHFDVDAAGVLVIESRTVMLSLIEDPPSFDYRSHVRAVELSVRSSNPW
jgi:hypothetical protein